MAHHRQEVCLGPLASFCRFLCILQLPGDLHVACDVEHEPIPDRLIAYAARHCAKPEPYLVAIRFTVSSPEIVLAEICF